MEYTIIIVYSLKYSGLSIKILYSSNRKIHKREKEWISWYAIRCFRCKFNRKWVKRERIKAYGDWGIYFARNEKERGLFCIGERAIATIIC